MNLQKEAFIAGFAKEAGDYSNALELMHLLNNPSIDKDELNSDYSNLMDELGIPEDLRKNHGKLRDYLDGIIREEDKHNDLSDPPLEEANHG